MGTVEAWEIASPNTQLMPLGENNVRVTGYILLAASKR